MIRQSLVEERVSALHHHTLQSPGDNDGDMSRIASRRLPPPVGSRIVIKKNASLLPTGDEIIPNSTSTTPSPTATPTVDPRSRVELLERNLRYVQQQHEMTLNDLHLEINRLQEENRDLHFRMINLRPPSGSQQKQKKNEMVPSIPQITELTHNEPVLEKRLQEVQRLHFEQQIDELRTRLVESEEKNQYLTRTIDQLNRATSKQAATTSSPDAGPVLLPDPNPFAATNMAVASENKTSHQQSTPMGDVDYQHLLSAAHEKQRQQLQEIARLRAVLREILHAERLSSTSKLLARDCLAASTTGDLPMGPIISPIDISYPAGHPQQQQQRMIASSSTGGKGVSFRQPADQRVILPPIQQSGNTSTSTQDPNGALNSPLSPTSAGLQQRQGNPVKFGETSVARRERRTQELQRTRLTRNLYH